MNIAYKLLKKSVSLRRLILIVIDSIIMILCNQIWFSIYANKPFNFFEKYNNLNYNLVSMIVGLSVYFIFGQYKGLTKYTGSSEIYKIGIRNLIVVIVLYFLFRNEFKEELIIGFCFFYWYVLTLNIALSKFILRDLLKNSALYTSFNKEINNVAIYGAGKAGAQLAASIKLNSSQKIITFIDDNPNLWGRTLDGIQINPPKYLSKIKNNIDQVLMAIPSLNNRQFKQIFKKIQNLSLTCLRVPSLEEISKGKAKISSLRKISIKDLLKRDVVIPNKKLMHQIIKNKSICVMGGGGSIGSELCNQIISLDPKRIVILDSNEFNLYEINLKLKSFLKNSFIEIEPILGNCLNKKLITNILDKYKIDIIFHAAAYKHVPIVEKNPTEGITNNIISTKVICSASKESHNVKEVVFISSDKAVRPTNIMGASKRFSELIVSAYDQIDNTTNYSIVRFGNVLGSSGSVVPLFEAQISAGGPITLTHEMITRYFMTPNEAAQLVIYASSLSDGGDTFLLDMGEPVSIFDLAKQMIKLSGLTLKDDQNPDGDIEIVITGLREGEKLFEELLIEPGSIPTKHPLIFKANERKPNFENIFSVLKELENAIENNNPETILASLKKLVPEWKKG